MIILKQHLFRVITLLVAILMVKMENFKVKALLVYLYDFITIPTNKKQILIIYSKKVANKQINIYIYNIKIKAPLNMII